MARSATEVAGVMVSVSLALLFAMLGSVTPPGGITVAVLTRLPVALGEIVARTVYVSVAPTGRLTVSLMFPDPEALQLPPLATQVQIALLIIAGNTSLTTAPITSLGPAFDTTMVLVTVC